MRSTRVGVGPAPRHPAEDTYRNEAGRGDDGDEGGLDGLADVSGLLRGDSTAVHGQGGRV
jgi:hypothetical protein